MILGITGGVATGKSAAAAVLARQGVHVIDCDDIARHLTSYDSLVLQGIELAFGPGVFTAGGALDRSALAQLAFSDDASRRRLEQLLHPRIGAIVHEGIRWARQSVRDAAVVIPLLFESGWQAMLDETWVVTCSAAAQLDRAAQRGWTKEETLARIRAQMPLEEKVRLATSIVDNSGSLDELESLVLRLWEGRSKKR